MRTMYDSVTASDVPLSAELVGGYVDGIYAWSAADWHRFAGKPQARITVTAAANDANVLDCENGDATPQQCPGWVLMRRAAGVDPTVYMNASTWAAVRSAFAAQHVAEPHYWVAAYDGDTNIPTGAIAKQYQDPPASGGHYDLSSVADYWPGVDPAPQPPEEDFVKVLRGNWNGQQHIVAIRQDGSLAQWYDFNQPPEGISQPSVVDFDLEVDLTGANTPGGTPQVRIAFIKSDGSVWNAYQNIGSSGWNPQPVA